VELRQGGICDPASHEWPSPEPRYLRRIMGFSFEMVNEFRGPPLTPFDCGARSRFGI
jgi:hypothetical protein